MSADYLARHNHRESRWEFGVLGANGKMDLVSRAVCRVEKRVPEDLGFAGSALYCFGVVPSRNSEPGDGRGMLSAVILDSDTRPKLLYRSSLSLALAASISVPTIPYPHLSTCLSAFSPLALLAILALSLPGVHACLGGPHQSPTKSL